PHPRWLRLLHRVRCGALLPRRATHDRRRGNKRDPTQRDRKPVGRARPNLTGGCTGFTYHRIVAKKSAAHREASPNDAVSKSARTRSRILNAAAHILSVKGYAGTRLSDVAEYAELQAPAIYYYFPSRDDLIEEVMYAGIADMRRHLQGALEALPRETSPIDKILAAVEAHLRHELELSDYASASIRNA